MAVLFCDLVSRPFANMGIADDGPYILMAQKLAAPFAPIHYSRWPYRTPGTLYVVHSSRIVPKESAPTR